MEVMMTDQQSLKRLLDEWQKNIPIDIFSKEYLFNKKHAEHRNQIIIDFDSSKFIRRSRLSILLREAMTEERRENIFDQPFDLGNMKPLPEESCTYVNLADELYGNGRVNVAAKDAFETIKKRIHQITGKRMQDHFNVNKSTTLKVVKTLDVLMRQRRQSLMQLFKPPEFDQKFSMSFRDSGFFEGNHERMRDIADLKAYLSVELCKKRFEEICSLFYLLDNAPSFIYNMVEKTLVGAYQSDYAAVVSAYGHLTMTVKDFQFRHTPQDIPLDEELFIHLHALEFLHFTIGLPKLLAIAIPECSITKVNLELLALTKSAFPQLSHPVDDCYPLLSIREIPEFSLRWRTEIVAIVEKATGINMAHDDIERNMLNVQNLLRNFYWFKGFIKNKKVLEMGPNQAFASQDETKVVSPWYVVAAFCCIWHPNTPVPEFEPFWPGRNSQGKSLKTTLNISLLDAEFSPDAIDKVPEEHRHIWSSRLEWFADALHGHAELREKRFNFQSAMCLKLADICKTGNIESLRREMSNFINYIRRCALRCAD